MGQVNDCIFETLLGDYGIIHEVGRNYLANSEAPENWSLNSGLSITRFGRSVDYYGSSKATLTASAVGYMNPGTDFLPTKVAGQRYRIGIDVRRPSDGSAYQERVELLLFGAHWHSNGSTAKKIRCNLRTMKPLASIGLEASDVVTSRQVGMGWFRLEIELDCPTSLGGFGGRILNYYYQPAAGNSLEVGQPYVCLADDPDVYVPGGSVDMVTTTTGSINDMLLRYFQDRGATSDVLRDAEAEFLASKGFSTGTLQDRWFEYLGSLGYAGTLAGRVREYWCNDLRPLLQLPQPDPVTGRYDLGQWADGRASDILVRDFEGIYRTIPGGVMPLEGGRVVKNLANYSEDFLTNWAYGGTGRAPDATSTFLSANDGKIYIYQLEGHGLKRLVSGRTHTVRATVKVPSGQGTTGVGFRIGCTDGSYVFASSVFIQVPDDDAIYVIAATIVAPNLTGDQTGSQLVLWTENDSQKQLYCYGIQCEVGDKVSEYVARMPSSLGLAYFNRENGNTVDANGIVTEAPGALISPEPYWVHAPDSTNLVDYSDDATQWSTIGDIVIARKNGVFIAGRQAFEISGQTALWHYAEFCEVLSQTGKHVATIFIAAGSTGSCRITLRDNTAGEANFLDFTIGSIPSITQPGASVPEYISHKAVPGGYLYTVALTPAADGNDCRYRVSINTTVSTDTILVAGAQVEAKSFATPLIETNGAPASRDRCNMRHPTSGYLNESEGVLIYDVHYDISSATAVAEPMKAQLLAYLLYTNNNTKRHLMHDGGSAAFVEPDWSPLDHLRFFSRWNVQANEKQVGCSVDGGPWDVGAIKPYDGSHHNLGTHFYIGDMWTNRNIYVRQIRLYNKDMGTQWIEDNF